MKHLLLTFSVLFVLVHSIKAQYCTNSARFTETPVFSNTTTPSQIKIDSNVRFARVQDWYGNFDTLRLTVTYPKLSIDPLPKRPMIMMFFGGAFIGGKRQDVDNYCLEFAKRGYVGVSIDYRLGKDISVPCTDPITGLTDSLSHEEAVYRAVQDANAALRYMVANSAVYGIDTAWIFVGGYSAGAGIANALAYNSQAEYNANYPTIVAKLGKVNKSGNPLTNKFSIKAIFNNWGAVASNFYDDAEALPMVAFHGGQDNVVPVDSALDTGPCQVANHQLYGSLWMHNRLTSIGKCADLTIKPNGGHGVYQDQAGKIFRIERASCFFKSLFCNTCTSFSATTIVHANCSGLNSFTNEPDALKKGILNESEDHTILTDGALRLMTVSPNPFESTLVISGLQGGETLEFTNLLGESVYKGDAALAQDFSMLPKGIYFLKIKYNNAGKIVKVVKE